MLTAIVLTYNEASRIRKCLGRLDWVDEILVIDSGSSDETVQICRQWPKVRVLERALDNYAAQRNFGIQEARGTWILKVDADEEVQPALAEEIQEAMRGNLDGYWIPLMNFIFGRPLRFGEVHGCGEIRLFKRSRGHYAGAIHETLVLSGTVGRLQTTLLHHSHESVSAWTQKMNRYTSMEAEMFVATGRRFRWTTLLFGPWGRFAKFYVLRQGWRDGWVGFLYTALGSFYFFMKHLKFREISMRGGLDGGAPGSGI